MATGGTGGEGRHGWRQPIGGISGWRPPEGGWSRRRRSLGSSPMKGKDGMVWEGGMTKRDLCSIKLSRAARRDS